MLYTRQGSLIVLLLQTHMYTFVDFNALLHIREECMQEFLVLVDCVPIQLLTIYNIDIFVSRIEARKFNFLHVNDV